jgi:hypothetical protein
MDLCQVSYHVFPEKRRQPLVEKRDGHEESGADQKGMIDYGKHGKDHRP